PGNTEQQGQGGTQTGTTTPQPGTTPDQNNQAGAGTTVTPAPENNTQPGQGTETKPGTDQQGQGAPDNTKPGENGTDNTV
ncbi:signal peptide protein, partial [Staphylococcus epidermidis]